MKLQPASRQLLLAIQSLQGFRQRDCHLPQLLPQLPLHLIPDLRQQLLPLQLPPHQSPLAPAHP